jgi:hypothetical protein
MTYISVVTTAWVVRGVIEMGATAVALELGAIHFVQIVDVEVLRTVDMTVVTCVVGLPPGGVVMLVMGQGLVVV